MAIKYVLKQPDNMAVSSDGARWYHSAVIEMLLILLLNQLSGDRATSSTISNAAHSVIKIIMWWQSQMIWLFEVMGPDNQLWVKRAI